MFKVNLTSGNLLNGYLNISHNNIKVENLPENTKVLPGFFGNLDPVLVNESCEEIIFSSNLNYLTPEQLIHCLNHWKSKLVNGGIIKIFFLDIRKIAKNIYAEEMGLEEIHQCLLGKQYEVRSVLDTFTVRQMLKELNLKINYISQQHVFVSMELEKI